MTKISFLLHSQFFHFKLYFLLSYQLFLLKMKKALGFALFFFLCSAGFAQLGGKNAFQFLKFPISARNEALGGGVLSLTNKDIAIALSNPSLIDSSLHKQIAFSNSFFISDINIGNLAYAHYHKKIKTTLTYAMQYASYGKFEQRDNAGNLLGDFKASDFNFQVGASHFWQNLHYGLNLKLLYSNLGQFNSLALATDIALGYHNYDKQISFSVLLRNAGLQLKKYDKTQNREKLPLQLDATFSKKFNKIPIAIVLVAQNLQTWKLVYPITTSNNNLIGNQKTKKNNNVVNNLMAHFVFGAEIDAGKPVRLRIGYNHLRRLELASTQKKGLAGICAGMGLNIRQFGVDYGFGAYHASGSDHYLTLKIKLDEFGKKAK